MGSTPSVPFFENLCNRISVHLPFFRGANRKTVPYVKGPPSIVVPYKRPVVSKVRPPQGFDPSYPLFLKLCSIFSVHFPSAPGVNSKTVPQPYVLQFLE